jgi:hypothetical protein
MGTVGLKVPSARHRANGRSDAGGCFGRNGLVGHRQPVEQRLLQAQGAHLSRLAGCQSPEISLDNRASRQSSGRLQQFLQPSFSCLLQSPGTRPREG